MEAVEWWNDEYINTKYRDHFEAKMRKMYEDHFDAMKYDILTVRTRVGDEEVRFRMYGPKRTSQTDDIVTASIRRNNALDSEHIEYLHQRSHCQDTDSCGLFVDIGANIGYWSLFMAHLGYDVLSFEAMTSNALLLYATLQDLVSPSIRDRVRVFPVALSNIGQQSHIKCILCSDDIHTQAAILNCDRNPDCDTVGDHGRYVLRETDVDVFNSRHFLDVLFPNIFSIKHGEKDESRLRAISTLKIDTDGHEREVLYPILDLFERGLVDNMFAECFGRVDLAEFFEHQIGIRIKLLNPTDLKQCKLDTVNLKFARKNPPEGMIPSARECSLSDIKSSSSS